MRTIESMILCAFQIGTGLALGSVFSLLLFKRRMWPLTFGLGAGFGMGYANCQNDINSKKWSIWTIQENLYYIVILNTSRSNLDITYVLNIIQAAYLINLSEAGRKISWYGHQLLFWVNVPVVNLWALQDPELFSRILALPALPQVKVIGN